MGILCCLATIREKVRRYKEGKVLVVVFWEIATKLGDRQGEWTFLIERGLLKGFGEWGVEGIRRPGKIW